MAATAGLRVATLGGMLSGTLLLAVFGRRTLERWLALVIKDLFWVLREEDWAFVLCLVALDLLAEVLEVTLGADAVDLSGTSCQHHT